MEEDTDNGERKLETTGQHRRKRILAKKKLRRQQVRRRMGKSLR